MEQFTEQITFLPVSDLERSTRFYAETLGLRLVLDQGDCRIFWVSGSAYVGICRREEQGAAPGLMLTLVTDDVDGWHERLTTAGVPCDRAPAMNETYHLYQAFYRDPDGYTIEIQRFLDTDWNRS